MENLRTLTALNIKGARKRERGFALLLLVFFTALMLIAVMAATPRILTEAKRQKEQEMIWRGNQYVRGVKLYYRKMGRFPTSLDDLTKPKTGARRFMRQAYKDPMNTGDGSWRLIYVGPAGQLIGSLKPPKTLQMPGVGPGLGASASSVATNSTGGSSAFGSSSGSSAFGSSSGSSAFGGGQTMGGAGANGQQPGTQQNGGQSNPQTNPQGGGENAGQPGQPGQPGTSPDGTAAAGTDASGTNAAGDVSTPEGGAAAEAPTIIGGNIIGVGSKISARSVMVYDKAKNYHLFEFVWDPSKDVTIAGQPPTQTGTGLGQNIGGSPSSFGQQPGATNPNLPQPGGNNPNGGAPVTPPLDPAPAPQPPPETQ
jgi:hypothetical protein